MQTSNLFDTNNPAVDEEFDPTNPFSNKYVTSKMPTTSSSTSDDTQINNSSSSSNNKKAPL
ncbi:MAG: hypothetical protein MHPSP_001092, partial [Paramarteilia canceri]